MRSVSNYTDVKPPPDSRFRQSLARCVAVSKPDNYTERSQAHRLPFAAEALTVSLDDPQE
jgi:hypothetical protein